MKTRVLMMCCLALGVMLSGCDAVRYVLPGSIVGNAKNSGLPQLPRDLLDGLQRDPGCPIAGVWIRKEDAYATMVVEIRKNLQGKVSGTLLYVPMAAQVNNFRPMDVKLREVQPTSESLREYEALSLIRYRQDPSQFGWSEVTIRFLDDDKFVLQERVWVGREVGHRQVWHRVKLDTVDMAYVHYGKARNALQMGDIDAAASLFAHAAQGHPDDAHFCNELAWELAVSSHAEIRRPRDAIALAKHACQATGHSNPMYLDTLAAAYAADGRYPEAVDTQRKAIQAIDGFVTRSLDSMGDQLHPMEVWAVQYGAMIQGAMEGYDNPEEYMRKLVLTSEGIDVAEFQHRLELYQKEKPYVRP